MKIVAVINYGCGNIPSIVNMLNYLGIESSVITEPDEIGKYESIILPGVGHFQHGMNMINNSGFRKALDKVANEGCHILGICLGMQLMTSRSEEASAGLGWFKCKTRKFSNLDQNNNKVLVPHMGWDTIKQSSHSALFATDPKFYFVHSYYVDAVGTDEELCTSRYGGVNFSSVIKKGNLMGVQFHPEKSHTYGMNFFREYFKSIGVVDAS